MKLLSFITGNTIGNSYRYHMNVNHLIGEFVIITRESCTGLIIAASQSNTNPLNNCQIDNSYPLVYYVLISDGLIKGPLFSSEIRTLCLFYSFKLINVNS